MEKRDLAKKRLFYGQGQQRLSYTAVRVKFAKYLEAAGLAHKGYSLHCLGRTCATELLNAGMGLECLQQLLGHRSIEMTQPRRKIVHACVSRKAQRPRASMAGKWGLTHNTESRAENL